ncbi:MAG: c-type cytochrome [Bacteroidales bacterium]|jgi:mono/diheme cytochrome c family protein|nr:c-type cytochrome [Bacteroidales bacterium]
MKSLQLRFIAFSMGMFLVFSISFNSQAQTASKWNIPVKFKTTKNPVAVSKASVADGKDLFAKHCKSCHGSAGLGDGPKAASLDVSCSDFSAKKFQAQSDGEIFFQISEGKEKMPSFKKNVPEDSGRWSIVNYIRTLAAK